MYRRLARLVDVLDFTCNAYSAPCRRIVDHSKGAHGRFGPNTGRHAALCKDPSCTKSPVTERLFVQSPFPRQSRIARRLYNVALWHELTVRGTAAVPSGFGRTSTVPTRLAAYALLSRNRLGLRPAWKPASDRLATARRSNTAPRQSPLNRPCFGLSGPRSTATRLPAVHSVPGASSVHPTVDSGPMPRGHNMSQEWPIDHVSAPPSVTLNRESN